MMSIREPKVISGIRRLPLPTKFAFGAALASALVIAGCSAPQYDDQTDKLVSQLQTDIDTELVTLISLDRKIDGLAAKTDAASQKALADAKTKAGFDANSNFYDKMDVELTSLQTRVDAEPSWGTQKLDGAISLLRANLLDPAGSMQSRHIADNILPEPFLRTTQAYVDPQLKALVTSELELKSGSSGGK